MTNLIYMGNFSSLNVDPIEGNYDAENAALLNGVTADHNTLQIVTVSISDGWDGCVSDNDTWTSDCISYNTGSGATTGVTDASLKATLTVTLQDGSTLNVEAVVMQMTNGDLFVSDLLNCGTLDNLQISNIEITTITGSNYSGWYSNQSVDSSAIVAPDTVLDGIVEGTNDGELIDGTYQGDPDGDMIDAGDAILAGEAPQDDIVDACGGNDTVLAGAGNDDVYAGSGADSVDGGTGDDLIYGDSNYAGGSNGGGTGVDLLQNGSFEDGTHAVNSVNGLTGWTTTSGSPDSADDGTSSESLNPNLDANDGTGYVTMWSSNFGPQEAI
jgi:hypothetical protein